MFAEMGIRALFGENELVTWAKKLTDSYLQFNQLYPA